MVDRKILLDNIDKIHTTKMGAERVKRNLKIDTADVVEYCINKLLDKNCHIYKQGKNWYCEVENIKITIHSCSYTIITAHMIQSLPTCTVSDRVDFSEEFLMSEREDIIRLWFDMWMKQKDLGIGDIFIDDVVYIESWGPKYENLETVKHWFDEWNTRGKVLVWDIKQFFHQGNQTVVEWYFKNKMDNGNIEEFDGMSLIIWTKENKIKSLKEFGCHLHNYNPYQDSDMPVFREEKINWF